MKRLRHNLKHFFIMTYMGMLILSFLTIGIIVFSSWFLSAQRTIDEKMKQMNHEMVTKMDGFLNEPVGMNQMHQAYLALGRVDLNNLVIRETFFVNALMHQEQGALYSFGYGTEEGAYYGARLNDQDDIEIMRNDITTAGHSWYYETLADMTAGQKALDAGAFDPRSRAWYQEAVEQGQTVFSPVYKHFVMDDLTVSVATPIYDATGTLKGVLASHMLLGLLDNYLQDVTEVNQADGLIFEQDSMALLANTMDYDLFQENETQDVIRTVLRDVLSGDLETIYLESVANDQQWMRVRYEGRIHRIGITHYERYGLNWVMLTVLDESLFLGEILSNLILALIWTLIVLLISYLVFTKLLKKRLGPVNNLVETTRALSSGDLNRRAMVSYPDEIGDLAIAFNEMADKLHGLVNNLEAEIDKRTAELKENKEQLTLILNSTAEGVYGVDCKGICTFCNQRTLELLGYDHADELVGHDLHSEIHQLHRHDDVKGGCRILDALKKGKGLDLTEDVFFKKNGQALSVEYASYPQYKNDSIIGAVVTFRDNAERKERESHIEYLSYHDTLTGLYNRSYFNETLEREDTNTMLPISLIFGDVNGLKLTNDIFGHKAGDALLIQTAEILEKMTRDQDTVARVGGDEFAILLPNTDPVKAEKIMTRIRQAFEDKPIGVVGGTIALGCGTKISSQEAIESTMQKAEDHMYKQKTLNRKVNQKDIIERILKALDEKSPREMEHGERVSQLCEQMGRALKMSEPEIRRLREAGRLHDIGKIGLSDELLNKKERLTDDNRVALEQHVATGYRILNLFEETLDLSNVVLSHHENYDGSGFPAGLKGEEIPLLSRIIKIAESYDAWIHPINRKPLSKAEALDEIKAASGTIFDPKLAQVFSEVVATSHH